MTSIHIEKLNRNHSVEAFDCTLQAADIAGIRAFAVHAKDDQARAFYEHFGFLTAPSDAYHLLRLIKDIRALAS